MKKALIVIFHNNSFNYSPLFRILWEYFKTELLLWQGTFDTLYLVDNGFDFTADDKDFLRTHGFNYYIQKIDGISVEDGLNLIFEKVKDDLFLLIHSDTFIYKKEIIRDQFELISPYWPDNYNLATIFDGSGKSLDFDLFKENENRGPRARFCNYLWFGRMADMRDISLDFTPTGQYPECASFVTEQLMEQKVKVKELQDDRSNILYDGKEITRCQWLDTPGKVWGSKYPLDLGYHHVRNFSNGFEVVNDFYHLKESYQRRKEIMPLTEILRILAWEKCIANKANQEFFVDDVIKDLGVDLAGWNNYLEEFRKFYKFL